MQVPQKPSSSVDLRGVLMSRHIISCWGLLFVSQTGWPANFRTALYLLFLDWDHQRHYILGFLYEHQGSNSESTTKFSFHDQVLCLISHSSLTNRQVLQLFPLACAVLGIVMAPTGSHLSALGVVLFDKGLGSVALWEKCLQGQVLRFQKPKRGPVLLSLPAIQIYNTLSDQVCLCATLHPALRIMNLKF